MNDNLEQALRALGNDPGPPELIEAETRVMRRIAGYKFVTSDVLIWVSAVTVAVSLGLGVAGGWFESAEESQSMSPLVGAHPLAPSSLLADRE